ncbi:hypothetical protein CP973_33010 [Streptomyces albofaciens JCM 4342]|nr:hypothetical protein CP973_33010 [Streptomyces albofaciens JCM 4342]
MPMAGPAFCGVFCAGPGVGPASGAGVCALVGGGAVAVAADWVDSSVSSPACGMGSPETGSRCCTGWWWEGVCWTGAPWGGVPTCGMAGRPPPVPVEALSPGAEPELSLLVFGGLPGMGPGVEVEVSGRGSGVELGVSCRGAEWSGAGVVSGAGAGAGAASGWVGGGGPGAGWVETLAGLFSGLGRAGSGVWSGVGWVETGSWPGPGVGWVLLVSEAGRAWSGVVSEVGRVPAESGSVRPGSGVVPGSCRVDGVSEGRSAP